MYNTKIEAIKVIISRRIDKEERVTIISDDGHSIDITLVASEIIVEDERGPEPADAEPETIGEWVERTNADE